MLFVKSPLQTGLLCYNRLDVQEFWDIIIQLIEVRNGTVYY